MNSSVANLHEANINKAVNKFFNANNILQIYGGITEQDKDARKNQHIRDRKLRKCETCDACQTCNQCETCTTCELCDECPGCTTCRQCNQCETCDNLWQIKTVTTIKIDNPKYSLDNYKALIIYLENYLIHKLGEVFPIENVMNDKKTNGRLSQTGGRGMQLNPDDVIKVYIFYKEN